MSDEQEEAWWEQEDMKEQQVAEAERASELARPICYASFRDVLLNDPYVASIMRQGGTAEMCVIELANQKNELLRRVVELEAIAPRRHKLADGSEWVWRCPDELVPLYGHNDELTHGGEKK